MALVQLACQGRSKKQQSIQQFYLVADGWKKQLMEKAINCHLEGAKQKASINLCSMVDRKTRHVMLHSQQKKEQKYLNMSKHSKTTRTNIRANSKKTTMNLA